MNMDSLNKWLMLAANIGVIAGIILLAVELQQNNDLLDTQIEFLEAQARYARFQTRQSGQRLAIENPLLGELRSRYNNGDSLQPHEMNYLMNNLEFQIINWEFLWSEYNAGLLDVTELAVDGRRESWHSIPDELKERWLQSYARFYQPEFIEWMEANIINP